MAEEKETSVFIDDSDKLNSKINAIPAPEKNIGIDTNNELIFDMSQVAAGSIDVGRLQSFTSISQKRDQLYGLLDSMAADSMVSAILEVFTEDATERNDKSQIVWAESPDENISKYVNFILDSLNVDKNVYSWIHSLCKYGDIYLKLFRESDVVDPIFDPLNKKPLNEELLDETINVKAHSKNDNYVFYVEQVPNPAEIFELTKFGKTYGFIQAPLPYQSNYSTAIDSSSYYNTSNLRYKFKNSDINIYSATDYVHAYLADDSDRRPEEVSIFLNDTDYNETKNGYTYTVRRGQSMLYDAFKIWRQLMLLENSILLNRLTKSAIVRVIGVEVGDMPKERVGATLSQLKSQIEQKSAINEAISMSEYTNPGAYENNIYVPTRNGQGNLTVTEVGGNTEGSGNLSDLDYFKTKFYGVFGIPKAYMGDTDDAAGFNGGSSLALLSSRYAKKVKRLQTSIIQALTDIVNLFLLDKGLQSYINRFAIKMVVPTTQEEKDRTEATDNKINQISNIMNLMGDVEDPIAKLKVVKILMSGVVQGDEVNSVLQDEIDRMQAAKDAEEAQNNPEEAGEVSDTYDTGIESPTEDNFDLDFSDTSGEEAGAEKPSSGESSELPNMSDLGMDFADSTNF